MQVPSPERIAIHLTRYGMMQCGEKARVMLMTVVNATVPAAHLSHSFNTPSDPKCLLLHCHVRISLTTQAI